MGVAAMILAVDGGRIGVGLRSGSSGESKCRINKAEDVASLAESKVKTKGAQTGEEKAREVAAQIRERGGMPRELLFNGKGKEGLMGDGSVIGRAEVLGVERGAAVAEVPLGDSGVDRCDAMTPGVTKDEAALTASEAKIGAAGELGTVAAPTAKEAKIGAAREWSCVAAPTAKEAKIDAARERSCVAAPTAREAKIGAAREFSSAAASTAMEAKIGAAREAVEAVPSAHEAPWLGRHFGMRGSGK